MVTIIVPTNNDEASLARMLPPLVSEVVNGTVTDVIVYDDASSDDTHAVCDVAGCVFMQKQHASVADLIDQARTSWLLFLPPGAILSAGWHAHVSEHIERSNGAGAAVFKLGADPNLSWWQRLTGGARVGHAFLPRGFLISVRQAKANLAHETGSDVSALMRGRSTRRLRAEIYVPMRTKAAQA